MDKAVRGHSRKLLGASISVLVSLSTGSAYAQSMSDMKEFLTPSQMKLWEKLNPKKNYTQEELEKQSRDIDTYSMCKKEIDHVKLYDFGKTLASGWMLWLKQNAKDEKQHPVRTRSSFMTRADIGYTDKYKITKDNEYSIIYHCRMGYRSTADASPWSSVHQGLVDYLSPAWKSKFLSLPER